MFEYLLQTQAFGGVHNEDAVDEVFGVEGYLDVGWEDVPVVFDILIGLFDGVVLEGRFAEEEGVHDNSDGPDIYLVRVALLL
jgi:hypothetical protein